MNTRIAELLAWGLVALISGCRPEGSDTQSELALAGAALQNHAQLAQQNLQDPLVIRRLWEGPEPDFWGASVSPEGRFKSDIDWASGGRLAMIDLLRGDLKLVPDTAWEGYDYAETSVFSPDGRRLAYTYWSEETQGYEIRIIGVDGSDRRTIVPNPGPGFYAEVKDWSDDGRYVLALLWDDGSRPPMRIALISVTDGSVRTLKQYDDWAEMLVCALAPDGRHVACDLASAQRADHDIYLLPVGEGREVDLLTGPADDRLLGWTPDGSGILFYSDRGLTKGIWLLSISNGRPSGEPVLLRGDVWGLEPIGFSRDAYYYGVTTQRRQVHTAIIDPQAWRLVTAPAAIEDPSLGRSWSAEWSPDGRHLAYIRSAGGQRDWKLVIRSVTGDDSREIAMSPIQPVGLLKWTADSQSILLFAREFSTIGVFKLDLKTGAAVVIWQFEVPAWPLPLTIQFAPDLTTAYFARLGDAPQSAKIMARDLASGGEREIATLGSIPSLSLSPDGRTLAFVDREPAERSTRIATVLTSGGETREIYRAAKAEEFQSIRGLCWSSDGQYILLVDLDSQANRYSLWRVPVAGGEPEQIELPWGNPPGLHRLRFHPDGNRIAFVSTESRGEIWVAENLPGTRTP